MDGWEFGLGHVGGVRERDEAASTATFTAFDVVHLQLGATWEATTGLPVPCIELLQIDDCDMIDLVHNRDPQSMAATCTPNATPVSASPPTSTLHSANAGSGGSGGAHQDETHASLHHYAKAHFRRLHSLAAHDSVDAGGGQGEKPIVVLQGKPSPPV